MATLSVWPAIGTTVTLDDLTVIDSSGASVTYTAEVRGLLNNQELLTYDPLGGDVDPDPATGISTIYSTTIASLSTVRGSADTQLAIVECHTTRGDGGGGQFVWDASSTTTSDNGATCVAVTGVTTGRWLRIYDNEIIVNRGGTVTAARINAALSVQNALGGGTVRVRKCAMTITGVGSDCIVPKSNTWLTFDPGCTIATGVPTGTSYVFNMSTTSGVSFEKIRISGNGCVITGDRSTAHICMGFTLGSNASGDDIDGVTIEGFEVTNMRYDGINIGGNVGTTTTNVVVKNCKFRTNYRNGGSATGTVGSARFEDCEFTGSNGGTIQSGFDIELDNAAEDGFFTCTDLTFVRCRFNDNLGQGFYGQSVTYGNQARVWLIDCEANDNGAIGVVANVDGMVISDTQARRNTTVGIQLANGARATECVASDNGTYGMSVFGGRGENIVSRCTVEFNVSGGMLVNTTARSNGSTLVEKNTIRGNRGSGLYLSGACDVRILGNSITLNKRYGLRLSNAENCIVGGGNKISQNGCENDATYDNVLLENSSNANFISDNMIRMSPCFFRGVAVVDAATTTTGVKLHASASKRDSAYLGMMIRIISGTGSGAYGMITGYVGSTQVATVYWDDASPATSGALGAAPDGTSVCQIVGGRLFGGTIQSAPTTTTVRLASALAPHTDDVFNGCVMTIVSGTGSGQTRTISDYTGSTQTVALSAAWTTQPDYTSTLEIVAINRPRYGVNIDTGCYYTDFYANDNYYGGHTGAYNDSGTSTNTSTANRAS